jgi:beta-glucosidase/6-phospho-beta-glucosidase/beta-galactosidase
VSAATPGRPAIDWSAAAPMRFAVGIEDTFVPQEYPGRRKLDEYELTQHYRFWREDLDLAARTGAGMIRWGVPWYLVEPAPGRFEWSWLDDVVEHLDRLDLTCMVDLMHYGTPLWMEDQFLHPDYPQRVAEYAARIAERYQDRLHVWTPLNEPIINAIYCGETGLWPPHLTGQRGFVAIALRLAEGICRTQRAIAEIQPEASFVHVEAGFRYAGSEFPLPLPVLLERRFAVLDLVTGAVGPQHPLRGWLVEHGAQEDQLDWFTANAVRPDVVGVNYYPAFTTTRYEGNTAHPVEAGTDGLEELVRTYHERYNLPLFVTETSRAGSVAERVGWLRDSVALLHRLRDEGLPVVGYTWWPLFALVDWLYRESDEPVDRWLVQMGLVDLVRSEGVLQRHQTPLVDEFRRAAAAR